MEIRVVEARDLLAADRGGTSDPFAVLEVLDGPNGKVLDLAVAGSSKVRTKTIKKTLAPKWDETFSFERPAEHGCWLRVVVWDDDLMVWTKLRGV